MVQSALGFRDQQSHNDCTNQQKTQSCNKELMVRRPAAIQVEGVRHCYPPNLAPALTPHIAIVSSRFKMMTTVILARIARPAATPTP